MGQALFWCPPSAKWPAAKPFYFENAVPHVSKTRVVQRKKERENHPKSSTP